MSQPPFDDDAAWNTWRDEWSIREDTIYLNHGSFGPPPHAVRAERQRWQDQLECQPMDFFVRHFEPAWLAARDRLAAFVGTAAENLILIENATAGMNLVAANFPLRGRDQVLLTNHEYGAVHRIWQRACRRAGVDPPAIARLPSRFDDPDRVVDQVLAATGPHTRLIVISHITSPTALILPVDKICREARSRGIAVCIDGPHAVAQIPLAIDAIGCDYYTASCHKWLSAPSGSGFLAVAPHHQAHFEPALLSWGRLLPQRPERWYEEFIWSGTHDPSGLLAIPAAIDLLERVGLNTFRQRTHALARYARERLVARIGREPPLEDSPAWYGSMALVPLPPLDARSLQQDLWRCEGIEVPIIDFEGEQFVRVSCHLYNAPSDIDCLVGALEQRLG
jgi:isopenicillin-N epimerase